MKRLIYVLIAALVLGGVYLFSVAAPVILFAGAGLTGLNIKRMVSAADGGWDDEAVHHAVACGLMMFGFGLMLLLPSIFGHHGGPIMRVLMTFGAVPAVYYFGGDLIKGVKPTHLG